MIITRIYAHYSFEQAKFKKGSVIMYQVSRQNTKTSLKSGLYKVMNNTNLGYDCCNNADNCTFAPIFHEVEELFYAKHFQNFFDQNIFEFVSSELLQKQIEEEFLNKICALNQNAEYFEARKSYLKLQEKKELDTVYSMKKSRQIKHKKNTIKNIDQKTKDEERAPKTKTMLGFDQKTTCSIKCLAIKKDNRGEANNSFFSKNMLMFAKMSFISCIYNVLEAFCFLNEKTKAIYEKYMIKIIIPFHVLTNTNSTCMRFYFLCEPESTLADSIYRYCLFSDYGRKDIVSILYTNSGTGFLPKMLP